MTKTILSVACVTLLSACAQQGPSPEEIQVARKNCDGSERCVFANLAADEYNKLVGKPLGLGVSIRGANTDGRVLRLAINVPERITSEPARGGRTVEQELAHSFKKDLCGDPNTRRFFDIGGSLEVTSYLPSGARFAKTTVDSC